MRRSRPAPTAAAVVAATLAGIGFAVAGGPAGAARGQDAGANDPGLPRQWALERIGAPAAWEVATGAGVTIAIVDSGLDLNHPDLRDKIDGSTDCVEHDDAPGGCLDGAGVDDAGHGTHVAGIAAASSGNGQGVAGVAPLARLLSVRVLSAECGPDASESGCEAEGTESDVAEGIRWAADHGADVINLSLGSVTQAVVGPGQAFNDALDHAWSRGAIPVLVAGNDLLLPGSLVDVPAVIVSATDRDDRRTSYSNGVGNVRWAVAAPGGEADTAASCEAPTPNGILSTFYRPAADGGPGTSGYACVAGTSMAAPHVAGALAVLRSAGFGPEEAVDRLLGTAEDLGTPGPDSTFGAGRIDLAAALDGVSPTGQPISAADAGGSATTDITAPASPTPGSTPPEGGAGSPATVPTGATTTSSPPGGGGSVPAAPGSEGDEPTPGPDDDERAGARGQGAPSSDPLPVGPATVAVLAVVAVGTAHGWRYLATAGWGRRTPR